MKTLEWKQQWLEVRATAFGALLMLQYIAWPAFRAGGQLNVDGLKSRGMKEKHAAATGKWGSISAFA